MSFKKARPFHDNYKVIKCINQLQDNISDWNKRNYQGFCRVRLSTLRVEAKMNSGIVPKERAPTSLRRQPVPAHVKTRSHYTAVSPFFFFISLHTLTDLAPHSSLYIPWLIWLPTRIVSVQLVQGRYSCSQTRQSVCQKPDKKTVKVSMMKKEQWKNSGVKQKRKYKW